MTWRGEKPFDREPSQIPTWSQFGLSIERDPSMEYHDPLNAGLVLPFQRPRDGPIATFCTAEKRKPFRSPNEPGTVLPEAAIGHRISTEHAS